MWRVIVVQHHRDTVCDVSILLEAISFSWLRRSWACRLLSWCKLAHILESDEWMQFSNNRNWRNLVSLATNVATLVCCCCIPKRHIDFRGLWYKFYIHYSRLMILYKPVLQPWWSQCMQCAELHEMTSTFPGLRWEWCKIDITVWREVIVLWKNWCRGSVKSL